MFIIRLIMQAAVCRIRIIKLTVRAVISTVGVVISGARIVPEVSL